MNINPSVNTLSVKELNQPGLKKRDRSIDVAKGVLIILVVVGHSGAEIGKYINWWRMPVFFMLSGFFFKPLNSYSEFIPFLKKNVKGMVVPYFVYLLLINIFPLIVMWSSGDLPAFNKRLFAIIYGGRALGNENGVFWFISVLFLTRILLAYLSTFLENKVIFYLTCIFLLVGVMESLIFHHTAKTVRFPLNIDVVAVASFFYFGGFMIKPYLKLPKVVSYVLVLFAAVIYTGAVLGEYTFSLDMKASDYYNLPFVILVPGLFLVVTTEVAKFLTTFKYPLSFFEYLGLNSLFIMYLHLFVNYSFKNYLGIKYGPLIFTLFGVFIPLVFGYFVSKNRFSKKLFMGS